MDNLDYPIVSQPKRIKLNLFTHQLTSIYHMEKLESEKKMSISNFEEIQTRVGILSDLTGYGKTFSILGLIDRDKMKTDKDFITKNYSGNNLIYHQKINLYENMSCNLIVVNPSLFVQWEQELSKTELKVGIVNSKKNVDEINPEEFDIVLCNSNMIGFLTSRFRKFSWKRLIIDEPLTFRMTDYNNFAFHFTWLITATPYELINHKKGSNYIFQELFSGNEELLKSVIIRNPDEYVKRSFNMPENIHIHHRTYNPMSDLLSGLVSPVVFEMITAGNIKEAIKFLGGDNKSSQSLYHLILNKKMEKCKELELQIEGSDKEGKIKLLERYSTVKLQIEELNNRLEEKLKDNCVICNDILLQPVFLPCCQNIICGRCILTWLANKKNCPLCRSILEHKELILINNENPCKNENCEKRLTKPQIILDLITKNENKKFIIFSNYDESFNPVKNLLDEEKINYLELKGSKDTRNKSIQSYKGGDIKVLFLNAKSNSAGLNLEETSDIILYHQMTDYCETQILGRANRIGRKEKLFVHHLD